MLCYVTYDGNAEMESLLRLVLIIRLEVTLKLLNSHIIKLYLASTGCLFSTKMFKDTQNCRTF